MMTLETIKKDEVTKTANSKNPHISRSSFEYSISSILRKVKKKIIQ